MAGVKNNANLGFIVTDPGKNNRPRWNTIDEIGGAINWVDDPSEARAAPFRIMLFSNDAIVWKSLFERRSNKQFHVFIGPTDKILMALFFNI